MPYNVLCVMLDDVGKDMLPWTNPVLSYPDVPPFDCVTSRLSTGLRVINNRSCIACAEQRCTMLTGRHDYRHGSNGGTGSNLAAGEYTLADDLTSRGYATAMFGKSHLGSADGYETPRTVGGFGHFAGKYPFTPSQNFFTFDKVVNGVLTSSYTPASGWSETDITDDAIAWIGAQSGNWFAHVCYAAAHAGGGIEYTSPALGGHFPNPPVAKHSYGGVTGEDGTIANGKAGNCYRAMIEATGREIERLFDAIDFSETVVIFCCDNGTDGNFEQSPFPAGREKYSKYDAALTVPLVVWHPDLVNPGGTTDVNFYATDFYPTIMGMAGGWGIQSPNIVDGADLSGMVRGELMPERMVYTTLMPQSDSVNYMTCTDGKYRLIHYNTGYAADELYHIASDPYEETNLGTVGLTGEALDAYGKLLYEIRRNTAKSGEQPVVAKAYSGLTASAGGVAVTASGVVVANPSLTTDAMITAPLKSGATVYTLWSRQLPSGEWRDTGLTPVVSSNVTFTDPSPVGRREYRITNNAPEPTTPVIP